LKEELKHKVSGGTIEMKIFLVYGGKSAEHDVSLMSAFSIIKEIYYDYYEVIPVYITRDGKWLKGKTVTEASQVNDAKDLMFTDVEEFDFSLLKKADESIVFPVLHGPNGEDGTVQGLFEVLEVPYVGAGVLASAAGMDKIISKVLFADAGLPQLPYHVVKITDWKVEPEEVVSEIKEAFGFPAFVKPANLGSSVGISEAKNEEELKEAIDLAFEYDHRVVVEKGVKAREIEVAVLGNEDVHTSVPGELVKKQQFYDYEEKYINNDVTLQIPAELPDETVSKLREYAAKAFLAIDGSGLTRADFFITDEGEIYINEVNTFPGFTPYSMYPKLWDKTGLSYGDLIEELIQLGLRRYKARNERTTKER
jgi:D-alanine-D-alanine ligase